MNAACQRSDLIDNTSCGDVWVGQRVLEQQVGLQLLKGAAKALLELVSHAGRGAATQCQVGPPPPWTSDLELYHLRTSRCAMFPMDA